MVVVSHISSKRLCCLFVRVHCLCGCAGYVCASLMWVLYVRELLMWVCECITYLGAMWIRRESFV
jgi:hypothetical protein